MRIVYVNLHTNTFFMRSMAYLINGQRAIDKHFFLLKWLIDNENVEIVNFITKSGSTLPGKYLKKITSFKILRKLEAKLVFKINKIPNDSVKFVTDIQEIKDDDVVILYGHFPGSQFDLDPAARGIKIADHIHFYGDLETANKLKEQNVKYYICEIDLQKYCGLYRKNYAWFQGKYIPRKFAYQPRFENKKIFSERKNKAVAMGTLTICDLPEFVEYYGTDVYQPKRKMIFDNTKLLEKEVDSYISNYQEIPRMQIKESDSAIKIIYKKMCNYFTNGKQKKYFSFDMVEKYNEYKMFVCPEDALGAYGIGVVEGMACGCAMIGWDYGAYEDLGLIAGVHYISYDGTVDDLQRKIQYYQCEENQKELENIAKNGCEFVRENFSQNVVAKEYYESLKAIVRYNNDK